LLPVHGSDTEKYVVDFLKQPAYISLKIKIISDNTYKSIEKSDFLIISSGTATLEAAIIGKPMVVIYKVDLVSELVARLVLKVDNIALVNIVSGKRICPELLQRDVNGKKIFDQVSKYLDNRNMLNNMIKEINIAKHKLGKPGAVKRIAKVVLSLILK
jgi:lipid-A-disaccharide synthase